MGKVGTIYLIIFRIIFLYVRIYEYLRFFFNNLKLMIIFFLFFLGCNI